MTPPLPAPGPGRPPARPAPRGRDGGEVRVLSLDDEAREELGLSPRDAPRTHGALALAARPAAPVFDPQASRQDRIAALRAHLDRVAPAPALRRSPALPSGLPLLDRLAGGWPRATLSEIRGPPGTGRLALLLPALQALTSGAPGTPPRPVAVVDPVGWLYPPGLPGVALERLLLVRPGARAPWAAEQLARSGAVPLVVLLDPPVMGRAARRLLHAAEAGDCALVVLHDGAERDLPAALRLEARGDRCFQLTRGGPPTAPQLQLPPP